jgi:predicted permease
MVEVRALFRILSRSRASSAAAVVLIGCGVAAATMTFAAADAVLWRALPYQDAARLAVVHTTSPSGQAAVSLQDFLQLRDSLGEANVAASGAFTPEYALTGVGEPRQIRGRVLSAGYFATLGISLAAGREFTLDEEKFGAGLSAILTDRAWGQLFGRRPIVGSSLAMNGRSYTVIGILPPFRDYLGDVDVYVPYHFPATLPRKIKLFTPIVRLAPVQSLASLKRTVEPGVTLTAQSLVSMVADRARARAETLFGAGAGLLSIATLNFIMLMAARAKQRHAELAIRASLGASRLRIVLLNAMEVAALAGAGVLLALFLARLALPLLQHQFGGEIVTDMNLGTRSFAFALAAGVLAASTSTMVIVFPQWRVARSSRTVIGARLAAGRGLVVAQLGLSVALGVSAVLLARSFLTQRQTNPGFAIAGRYTSRVALPATRYADPQRRATFWRTLVDRLEADGTGAAIATELPLTGQDNPTPFVATTADGRPLSVKLRSISPNYFEQMQMRITAGRALARTDTLATPRVVVINEQLARLLERNGPPVGQVLTFDFGGGPIAARVAGVVSNIRHEALHRAPTPETYFGFEQTPLNTYSVVIASPLPATEIGRRLRAVLDSIDSGQPFSPVMPYAEHVDRSLSGARVQLQLVGLFSAAAVVVAASGVYSLLTFIVTASRREWALRLAIGAAPREILRMVLRQSVSYACAGLVLGLALLALAAKPLSAAMSGAVVWDPAIIAGYSLFLAAVCVAAALLPAWRASAISAAECLQS